MLQQVIIQRKLRQRSRQNTPLSTATPLSPTVTSPNGSVGSVMIESTTCSTYFQVQAQKIKTTAATPVQRQSHSAVLMQTMSGSYKMLVFGGYKGRKYYNDMYEYDCEKQQWEQVSLAMKPREAANGATVYDDPPQGRMWHSGVYLDDEQKMVIFGGETDDEKDLSDMYEYDVHSRQWTQVKPVQGALWPCTRSCHSTVLRKRRVQGGFAYSMVIFGGNNDGHKMNDLFEYYFDEKRWVKLSDCVKSKPKSTRGTAPKPQDMQIESEAAEEKEENEKHPKARYNHTAVMRNKVDKMYVFGGKSGPSRLNDLWCFDFITQTWSEIETFGNKPSPRSVHSVVMLPGEDQMILFGGYNGNSKMNDCYCLDFNTMKWRQLTIYGDIPNPTSNLSLVSTQQNQKTGVYTLFMFGGYNGDIVVNDMYEVKLKEIKDEETAISQDGFNLAFNVSSKLLLSSCHSDVLVKVDGSSFDCHRSIISQSKKLDYMLSKRNTEYSEGEREVLVLKDIRADVFSKMLAFMYGVQQPDLRGINIVDLVIACKQYGLDAMVIWTLNELKQQVATCSASESSIESGSDLLNASNALSILREAEIKNQVEVRCIVLAFIKRLDKEQLEELLKSHEVKLLSKESVNELTLYFAESNSASPMQVEEEESKASAPQILITTAQKVDLKPAVKKPVQHEVNAITAVHKHIQNIFKRANPMKYYPASSPCSENFTSPNGYSDVVLISKDNEKFFAHKSILSNRCAYFASLFTGRYVESKQQVLKMDSIDSKNLLYLLEYMYGITIRIVGVTGPQSVFVTPSTPALNSMTVNDYLMDIASAASMLLLGELEQDCVVELSKRITPDNALAMLQFANDMHISDLKKACYKELEQSHSKIELIELLDKFMQCAL